STVFKKTRIYSSTVYGQCGTVNNNNIRTGREPSPEITQNFSFAEDEQGAVVEPFINLAEKAIYEFLVKHESIIPLEVVEKFTAKQRPSVSIDF
ncbi:5667_t:CDS:1, partial [Cetraspora pellucida]